MATDEGGKRTKFQCLIIARFTVAIVVAVLAFASIVVVLTAGLRREDISLSFTHGHIQAAQVLWLKNETYLTHYRGKMDEIFTIYEPAVRVDLWVSMDAHIPTRRANTTCNITTVLVFDMPNAPTFTGLTQIALIKINKALRKQSLDRWIPMTDKNTLSYIARTYGGMSEFTAMLQVNMTISSGVGRTPTNSTQYCWPVTIGHSRSTTVKKVTCKPSHHIDYAADSVALAPPPPPGPPMLRRGRVRRGNGRRGRRILTTASREGYGAQAIACDVAAPARGFPRIQPHSTRSALPAPGNNGLSHQDSDPAMEGADRGGEDEMHLATATAQERPHTSDQQGKETS
ncbi:hypothetical protein VPH35_000549 [Triticum aestivum]